MFVNVVLSLLISVALLQLIGADEPCQTPNGQNGNCVPINRCQILYSQVVEGISSSSRTYLRRSVCGYEGVHPKVCCPISSPTPATTETLIANSSLLPTSCGFSTGSRIFGGEETDLDEFPWMALLEFYNITGDGRKTLECGGSLINTRYVLTAAHCILPSLVGVRLGEYNTETEIDCIGTECAPRFIHFGIEKKIVFKSYRPGDINNYHDIALLRLDQEVTYSDFIKPICLPLTTDEIMKSYLGQNLTVAGWGKTENRMKSSIKLKVKVPVKELSDCMNAYKNKSNDQTQIKLDSGQMCAGGNKGQDSCRGDSGGPLMTVKLDKDKNVQFYVIGLVSFGPVQCGLENVPAVYTKVSKYVKWIVDNLEP